MEFALQHPTLCAFSPAIVYIHGLGSQTQPLCRRPFVNLSIAFSLAFAIATLLAVRADLLRRRLFPNRLLGWTLPLFLDVACVALTAGLAAGFCALLAPVAAVRRAIPLDSLLTWQLIAALSAFLFLWSEGRREIQHQRPKGIVFGEWLVLFGIWRLISLFVFAKQSGSSFSPDHHALETLAAAAIAAGGVWIAWIVRPFVSQFEGVRIAEHAAIQGEFVQAEYVSPTAECPHPEYWKMLDAQTAEIEVLDFLQSLVVTIKPSLILETGTFLGYSAIRMAEALKSNGFGRIVTVEFDPKIFARAQEKIDASGLRRWIDSRNQSSLDTKIDGVIDLLFSDSDPDIREAEIRRFLPQLAPYALVLVHDASSQFKVVREAALRLESEGLLSVVLLSTPRGLVVAQKHAGRR
jgi:predicted O-methyltransferase YrrM